MTPTSHAAAYQKFPSQGAWRHLNLFFRGCIFQAMNKMSNYTCPCLLCYIKLLEEGGVLEFYIAKSHISQVRAPICRRYLYISQRKSQPLQIVHINETEFMVPAEISSQTATATTSFVAVSMHRLTMKLYCFSLCFGRARQNPQRVWSPGADHQGRSSSLLPIKCCIRLVGLNYCGN